MSIINQGIHLIDRLVTPTSLDRFPLLESKYLHGGFHSVSTLTERDAIPLERRKVGMVCSVANDALYVLVGDPDPLQIANATWATVEIFPQDIIIDPDLEFPPLIPDPDIEFPAPVPPPGDTITMDCDDFPDYTLLSVSQIIVDKNGIQAIITDIDVGPPCQVTLEIQTPGIIDLDCADFDDYTALEVGTIVIDKNGIQARVLAISEGPPCLVTLLFIEPEEEQRPPISDYAEGTQFLRNYFVIHRGKLARVVITFTSASLGDLDDSFDQDISDGHLELISVGGGLPDDEFQPDTTYHAGQIIIFNSVLYRVVTTFTSSDTGDIDDDFQAALDAGYIEEFFFLDAANVQYQNPGYPDFESVKDALDALLAEVIEPDIVFIPAIAGDASAAGGLFEIGDSIVNPVFTWSINGAVRSMTLQVGAAAPIDLDPALGTYTWSGTISTDTVVIFHVIGATGSEITRTFEYIFLPRAFWGVSPESSLTDSEILALGNSALLEARQMEAVFDCYTNNEPNFIYFVLPTALGTPTFRVGGMNYNNLAIETRMVENQHLEDINMNIIKFVQIQTGRSIEVEIR